MQFAELVAAYERLAATRKRLEMRDLLADLFSKLADEELAEVCYLSQGLLRPEYEGIELGMADSLARRAVAAATGQAEPAVAERAKRTGDLGSTAEELLGRQRRLLEARPPTVGEVYATFRAIAQSGGEGSQEEKVRLLTELLQRIGPTEGKYAIRFALGQLRLGVREMTILDALAQAFGAGEKTARPRIEEAFNLSSDLGLIAQALSDGGLGGLSRIRLSVGRPVRPMLAERLPDLPQVLSKLGGRAAFEYKYDGLRLQLHVPATGTPRLFSRRLEEVGPQFPEVVAAIRPRLRRAPVIVEGECVPIDPETDELLPFQEISRRRGRKYDLERLQREVPVALFLFDILLDGKEECLNESLPERRRRLEGLVKPDGIVRLAEQAVVDTVPVAQAFFDSAIAAGCEGVMAKSLAEGSRYRAGARGFWWIKYKREYTAGLADSIDAVIVGAFRGRGRRGGRFGALLMAVYNPGTDRFESFCKVGSGFDDAVLAELPARLEPYFATERPDDVDSGLVADQWIRPQLVLELRGAELTLSPIHRAGFGAVRAGAGLALRFPRFTGRWRTDKAADDATTTAELLELFQSQVRRPSGSGSADEAAPVEPKH